MLQFAKKTKKKALVSAFITISLTSMFAEVEGSTDIYHWWVSESEAAALKIIVDSATARGADIHVIGMKSHTGVREMLQNLLTLNKAPMGTQWLDSNDLSGLKQLTDISIVDTSGNASSLLNQLDPEVRRLVEIDGQLLALPIVAHIQNILIINRRLHQQLGIDVPKTWNELIQNLEKFKEKGVSGLVVSDQAWQLRKLFVSILIGLGGKEGYSMLYDSSAMIDTSKKLFTEAFNLFFEIRGKQDDRSKDLSWVEVTRMLAMGETAMLFHGDYAHGELYALTQQNISDFDCIAPPGDQNTVEFAVDLFVFFNNKDAKTQRSQAILAETILDKDTQQRFVAKKGGVPVVKNTHSLRFDNCISTGLQRWNNPDREIVVNAWTSNTEMLLVFQDYLKTIWDDLTITADDAAIGLIELSNNR